jgi:YfiH family protein
MRSALKLPQFSFSPVLHYAGLEHRFFYRIDAMGAEIDFAATLNTFLIEALLHDLSLKRLLVVNQTHTGHVVVYPSLEGYTDADAIITDKKNVGLLIRHADCQAALFYDPIKKVIGAAHAGFKGQGLCIYTHTIEKMRAIYGSHSCDIRVAISPSLGLAHAEFIHYIQEFPPALHKYAQNNFMDLKKMACDELLSCGILAQHIDMDLRCTYEDEVLFYSYRRDKTSKRLASIIVMH